MDSLMRRPSPEIKPLSAWTYVVSLALWLGLCVGAMAFVVVLNVRDVERHFSLYGITYSDRLDQELVSSGTILKGFSACC